MLKQQLAREEGRELLFFIAVYGGRILSAFHTRGRHGRPLLVSLIRLRRIPLHDPNPATRLFLGLLPFCPWLAGASWVAPKESRPRGGAAAPVDEAPAGSRYDGSHADMRGAVPTYRAGVGLGRVTVAL